VDSAFYPRTCRFNEQPMGRLERNAGARQFTDLRVGIEAAWSVLRARCMRVDVS